MDPADVGLPAKFRSWRRGQEDAVIDAASSEKRFYMLAMPTGGGKSVTAIGISNLLGGRTLALTSTKGLQQQYTTEFESTGMVEIKGQNNYQCLMDTSVQCNEGPCHSGVECDLKRNGCLYYDAVRKAARARLVVTNYRYWMTVNRYSDPDSLGDFDTLILDEAHDAPEELADFCSVRIDKDELHALLEMDLPPLDESQDIWGEWAENALRICRDRLAAARLRIKEGSKYVRLVRRLNDMAGRLSELAKCRQWRRSEPSVPDVWIPGTRTDWVAEPTTTGALFSPIWAHAYAEQYLFKEISRVFLVSATLQPTAARYLGISQSEYEFREMESTFLPQRRPLIYIPTTGVSRDWTVGQQRIWLNRIDALVGRSREHKGIIHTGSYDRTQAIHAQSKYSSIMATHGTRNARDVVEAFRRSRAPRVLVSPSMETGWDFPYDQCRWQIIAKVPFVDNRSAIVKARQKSDKKYLNYLAALRLIQTYGRGMRAEDDFCETFIIDDNIRWFIQAAKKDGFIPKWVLSAYRVFNGIPEFTPIPELRRGIKTRA